MKNIERRLLTTNASLHGEKIPLFKDRQDEVGVLGKLSCVKAEGFDWTPVQIYPETDVVDSVVIGSICPPLKRWRCDNCPKNQQA